MSTENQKAADELTPKMTTAEAAMMAKINELAEMSTDNEDALICIYYPKVGEKVGFSVGGDAHELIRALHSAFDFSKVFKNLVTLALDSH